MARYEDYPASSCYHVLLRGNGGQDIFKDDVDLLRFYNFYNMPKCQREASIYCSWILSHGELCAL